MTKEPGEPQSQFEMEKPKTIKDAMDWQGLYNILNNKSELGELIDSDGNFHSAKKIKQIIYDIRSYKKDIKDLPDIEDLREKVERLHLDIDTQKGLDNLEKGGECPQKAKRPSLKEYLKIGHKS